MATRAQRSRKVSLAKPRRRSKRIRDMKVPVLFSDEWKKLPPGHPLRWLALAGTLTHEEAELIRASVEEQFEKVEEPR